MLARKVVAGNDNFSVVDKIVSCNDWMLSLHFDPSLKVERKENFFFIKKEEFCLKLLIHANESVEFELSKGYVTARGGHKEYADCVFIHGGAGSFKVTFDYFLVSTDEAF